VAAKGAAQVVLVLNLQSVTPCDKAGKLDGEFNPCGYEAEQHDRFDTLLPSVQVKQASATCMKVTAMMIVRFAAQPDCMLCACRTN